MIVGVGAVFELARHEAVRNLRGQLLGALDGADHAFVVGRTNHLRAQRLHQDDFFLRELLRNADDDAVSPVDADQRQSDTGITSRGFENRRARLQAAFRFRAFDDADCGAVLDAAARIQELEFDVNVGRARRWNAAQVEDGRSADQLGHVLGDMQARIWERHCWHSTG